METNSRPAPKSPLKMRIWCGWAPILLLPPAIFFLPMETPRWVVMWTLAFAIYVGCKWLTWRRTNTQHVPAWRQAAYLFAWPGLDASAFMCGTSPVARPRSFEWLFAACKFMLGCVIVALVSRIDPTPAPYLIGWLGMIGLMLVLHFGLFHLLSCFWRSWGIDARPLMNWPLSSPSISEFWGKRWNTAFRDLTHRFLFRPMTRRLGGISAIFVGFVFSGLIHDLVISLPAGGGYGGPTIFFVVQALGLAIERSRIGKRIGLGHGVIGWLFTATILLAPVGLLLHHPFVVDVVVPFVETIGGVWK